MAAGARRSWRESPELAVRASMRREGVRGKYDSGFVLYVRQLLGIRHKTNCLDLFCLHVDGHHG
jgi:hypothetical protein